MKLEAQEPDRTPSMAAKAAAMGIPQRRVGLAEAEGWLVAEVIRGVLGLAVMLAARGISMADASEGTAQGRPHRLRERP